MTGHGRLNAERAHLHTQELLREAERRQLVVAGRPRRRPRWMLALRLRAARPVVSAADRAVLEVRIRYAGQADEAAIRQLAALDSAKAPEPPLLIAEVDGRVLAAISLWDGRAVADPFRHTRALIELLAVRTAQIQSAAGGLDQLREPALRWRPTSQPDSPSG